MAMESTYAPKAYTEQLHGNVAKLYMAKSSGLVGLGTLHYDGSSVVSAAGTEWVMALFVRGRGLRRR